MFIKPMLLALAAGLVIGAPVMADQDAPWQDDRPADASSPDYDYARVTHVEPQLRQLSISVPQRECRAETRYAPAADPGYGPGYSRAGGGERPAAGGMILGGLIGAVIGHQFGYGPERAFGTVAGAVVGSAIGHDAAQRRDAGWDDRGYGDRGGRPVESERCVTRYSERVDQRIDGYRVSYRYNGRNYQTDLPYDPGERLRVRVAVNPEGY